MHTTRPLCAAPHCAIRNRHHTDCPVEGCWGCLPRPAADGLRLCDVDTRRIGPDAVRVAELHAALESAILGSSGGGEQERMSGSSTGAPVPDDEVIGYRAQMRAQLLKIVRVVTEQRGVAWPSERYVQHLPAGVEGPRAVRVRPTEDLAAIARFIARHSEWLAAHRHAASVSWRLRYFAGDSRIWALAYPAGSDRLYVGMCPMDVTEDDGTIGVCGSRLYQEAGKPLIACSGCRREETIEQWRRWLVADADADADAYQVAAHLSILWMRPVGPDVVKRWGQRGHISPATVAVPDGAEGETQVKRGERNRTMYPFTACVEYATQLWGPPAEPRRSTRPARSRQAT